MLIDSHIHLDAAEFAPDRAAVIETARAAGVRGFVVPAVDRASFDAVLALAAARALSITSSRSAANSAASR